MPAMYESYFSTVITLLTGFPIITPGKIHTKLLLGAQLVQGLVSRWVAAILLKCLTSLSCVLDVFGVSVSYLTKSGLTAVGLRLF